jgi:hypothetical protein
MNRIDTVAEVQRPTWTGIAGMSATVRRLAAVTVLGAGAATCYGQCEVWVPGPGVPGPRSRVYAVATLPNGDVVVGGNFTAASGGPGNAIAMYNPSTGAWTTLGTGMNPQSQVLTLAVLPDGDIVAGGNFVSAGGVPAGKIARYNAASGTWSALGTSPTDNSTSVQSLAVSPDGGIIAGGLFVAIGGVQAANIARYNPHTGLWSALGGGTDGAVAAVVVLPDGDVVAGGYFSVAGNADVRPAKLARYHPATDTWSAMSQAPQGLVYSLLLRPNGDLYAGGSFFENSAPPTAPLARFSQSTESWSVITSTTQTSYNRGFALAALPGDHILIGGGLTDGFLPTRCGAAQYHVPSDTWWPLAGGTNNDVSGLAVLPGGDVLAGGQFTAVGEVPVNGLTRIRLGNEPPVVTMQPVSQAATCPASDVTFTVAASSGATSRFQWRKNGVALGRLQNNSQNTATLVLRQATTNDIGVYDCVIASPCGTVTSAAVTLTAVVCPCPPADVAGGGPDGRSPDGTADGNDFIAFMNSFAIGDPMADVAGEWTGDRVPNGVIDVNDFYAFLNAFVYGC